MLAGAQSSRLSLIAGIASDNTLSAKCSTFITSVENLEGFEDMKEFFESLFGSLEDSELGQQLLGILRNGNLTALLSQLGPYEDIASWLLSCLAIEDPDIGELDKIMKEKLKALQRTIVDALSKTLQTPSLPEFEAWIRWKDKIIKKLKDDWETLNNMIEMLEDPKKLAQFTLYNIDPEDPCSVESIYEAIVELLTQFFEDLQTTFEELVQSAGGNIIAILIIVLAEYVAAELNNLIQQYGLDVLFGNALKALMNAIATILVALNGAKLYMQYLAAKALRSEVQLRLELCQNLSIEMSYLVQVLNRMKNVSFNTDDVYMEIYTAMGFVRKAKLGVGIELGKSLNGRQPSTRNLITAQDNIQKGIDALAPASETQGLSDIYTVNQLLQNWDINQSVYSYTDTELKLLAAAIRKRFFTFPDDYSNYVETPESQDPGYLDAEMWAEFYADWENQNQPLGDGD